jgi:hypothetical protein
VLGTRDFLTTVVTGESGFFCLAIGNNDTSWKELWFEWPQDLDEIVDVADTLKEETNVYFSTYLFETRSTAKECVLPSRTIQADLDDADVNNLPILPTVLVRTSPNRHQGYWLLKEAVDLDVHEVISRKLTYAIPGCDHSGWPLGRKVRIANTFNYKYPEGRHAVEIVAAAPARAYDASHLELLPDPPSSASENLDTGFLSGPNPIDSGPFALLETIRDKLPPEVYNGYDNVAGDRSVALWKLMCAAFRAGLSRDQVYWLARSSANNKFSGLRYNGDRELAKDVLRAESVVNSGIIDSRDIVNQARKISGTTHEKLTHLAETVAELLDLQGRFLRTAEENNYFIRADIGRPIYMTERSEFLLLLLDLEFGLNPTERETKFIAAALCNKARSSQNYAQSASLSYYDAETNTMFLHTGRKDVIRLTKGSISTVSDGAYDLLFPWSNNFQPFKLDFTPLDKPWEEYLFGDTAANVVEMPKPEALALLRVWLLFLFFRSEAVARPILALFGQPGSGKSTTFRKLYAFLYGKNRSLGAVTTAEDFDYAVASDPLVVLDNVDTWERWLPDRLALAASTSDIVKRKLYTDSDTVTLKRQAILAVTAHNPKFGREDVTDRLLILNLKRLDQFVAEGQLIAEIAKLRPQIYGAITKDIQRVLAQEEPEHHDLPQIRIEDFARLGYKIACALGIANEFSSSIGYIRNEQKSFILTEEVTLIDALKKLINNDAKNPSSGSEAEGKYRSAGQLWTLLETYSGDEKLFREQYRNAPNLGKKLWALYDALKSVMDVTFRWDSNMGARVWRFRNKNGETTQTDLN